MVPHADADPPRRGSATASVLYQAPSTSRRARSAKSTAFLMSSMLADVINAGTADRARALGFTLPAAGKTGTTNDYQRRLVRRLHADAASTGVWVGFDQPRTIMPNGFAGDVAVPLWAEFMKAATKGDKPEWFTPPAGVTTANVCRLSRQAGDRRLRATSRWSTTNGQLERRSMVYTEYFARGTEPTDVLRPASDARHSSARSPAIFSGAARSRAPPRVEDTGLPPPAADDGRRGGRRRPRREPPPPAAEPPKKKRGFWSRVFGSGGDKDEETERRTRSQDGEGRRTTEERRETSRSDRPVIRSVSLHAVSRRRRPRPADRAAGAIGRSAARCRRA